MQSHDCTSFHRSFPGSLAGVSGNTNNSCGVLQTESIQAGSQALVYHVWIGCQTVAAYAPVVFQVAARIYSPYCWMAFRSGDLGWDEHGMIDQSIAGQAHEDLEWAEDLPPQCPPLQARRPDNQEFYRLVSVLPPTERDFMSYRALFPNRTFNVDECTARAVSLHDSARTALELMKSPKFRNSRMVKLILPPQSGVVLRTGRQPGHFSWWRTIAFDPVTSCEAVVEAG